MPPAKRDLILGVARLAGLSEDPRNRPEIATDGIHTQGRRRGQDASWRPTLDPPALSVFKSTPLTLLTPRYTPCRGQGELPMGTRVTETPARARSHVRTPVRSTLQLAPRVAAPRSPCTTPRKASESNRRSHCASSCEAKGPGMLRLGHGHKLPLRAAYRSRVLPDFAHPANASRMLQT